jgi:hypothetical protein
VNPAAEERADREHDCTCAKLDASLRDDCVDLVGVDTQVSHFLLEQRQVRLILERRADCLLVEHPVRLRARRAHRRALAGIEGAKLDAGAVGCTRHDPAERVDLLDEVTLADAADRRIAAHLAERFDALSQQQRARTHAGRG